MLSKAAGGFGFVAFTGEAFAILASLLEQVEGVGRKGKFLLRDGKRAFASHGVEVLKVQAGRIAPYLARGSSGEAGVIGPQGCCQSWRLLFQ